MEWLLWFLLLLIMIKPGNHYNYKEIVYMYPYYCLYTLAFKIKYGSWFLKKSKILNDQLTTNSYIAGLKFFLHRILQVLNYHLTQNWLSLNFPDTLKKKQLRSNHPPLIFYILNLCNNLNNNLYNKDRCTIMYVFKVF